MLGGATKHLCAGTRVRVMESMATPADSVWDNDNQRTSNTVKRRLQQLFFKGDRRVQATVVYVTSETDRYRLKRANQVKLELRDPAGSAVVITASVAHLKSVA